jgi:hypothetical protein
MNDIERTASEVDQTTTGSIDAKAVLQRPSPPRSAALDALAGAHLLSRPLHDNHPQ